MRAPPPEGRYRARRIEPEPAKTQGRARKTGAIPNPNAAFKALWRGTSRRLIGGHIGTYGMVESCRAESRFRARNASNAAHRAIWLHLAARSRVFLCANAVLLRPRPGRIGSAASQIGLVISISDVMHAIGGSVEHCSAISCHSMLWRDVTLQFVLYFDIVFDVIAYT